MPKLVHPVASTSAACMVGADEQLPRILLQMSFSSSSECTAHPLKRQMAAEARAAHTACLGLAVNNAHLLLADGLAQSVAALVQRVNDPTVLLPPGENPRAMMAEQGLRYGTVL